MIQPLVKLRFVERYCRPSEGWSVFVDIDASEEGRTGSARQTSEAKARHTQALTEAPRVVQELAELGVFVGERKRQWKAHFGKDLPVPKGDRDIIAVHRAKHLLWIAEVEGDSGGQPEGKIYKALGQLVCAVTESQLPGFQTLLSLVVWGERACAHLARAAAVASMGISGLAVGERWADDRWLFGRPVHLDSGTPPDAGRPPNNTLEPSVLSASPLASMPAAQPPPR